MSRKHKKSQVTYTQSPPLRGTAVAPPLGGTAVAPQSATPEPEGLKTGSLLCLEDEKPTLAISPTAWAKLMYQSSLTEKELGGFGISDAQDPLWMVDFELVEQSVTGVSVDLEDSAVAQFLADKVKQGYQPWQVCRLYIHTHPFASTVPSPSGTDKDTFHRCFKEGTWAIMMIVGGNGDCYTRIKTNGYPGCWMGMGVMIDWARPFPASNQDQWKREFDDRVREKVWLPTTTEGFFPQHIGSVPTIIRAAGDVVGSKDYVAKQKVKCQRALDAEAMGLDTPCDLCIGGYAAINGAECTKCSLGNDSDDPCVACVAFKKHGSEACLKCIEADLVEGTNGQLQAIPQKIVRPSVAEVRALTGGQKGGSRYETDQYNTWE